MGELEQLKTTVQGTLKNSEMVVDDRIKPQEIKKDCKTNFTAMENLCFNFLPPGSFFPFPIVSKTFQSRIEVFDSDVHLRFATG